MKISIYNFKGINELIDFDLNKITVLSGANSCGKSSLIQFLLLFKQSFEFGTIDQILIINKPYVSLGTYRQITHNNLESNVFKVKFKLTANEVLNYQNIFRISFNRIFSELDLPLFNGCELNLNFHYSNASSKIYIDLFKIDYIFGEKRLWFSAQRKRTRYLINTNSLAFYGTEYLLLKKRKISIIDFDSVVNEKDLNINFIGLFPISFIENSEEVERPSTLIKHIQNILQSFFDSIQYIGPLREEPKSYYVNEDDTILQLGNKGQNSAHILARNSEKPCLYYRMNKATALLKETNSTLKDAVKYWLCDVFKMAKNISIDKKNYNSFYVINIVNENSTVIPITHVGFGISQVLPIIVAGLALEKNGILILEQPEIHLHPKVQSLLFDFLHSLIRAGKTVLVETHSDHFITRLRRRIVEDESNYLAKNTGLYFVHKENNNIVYEKLTINELGNMGYWPEDFFDQRDQDLKAIIKAQSIKKLMNK
ncbi:MAG TPA: DUF3696 domain-containing protein [Prolixibacteraceae bacterium]|nr:DUF3696 domain-containing protein [Prolixibacteraceae bacterium]